MFIYGGADRDLIRTDWFEINGDNGVDAAGDQRIYGDYKYGADALDKDLWGDADRIYGGRGDGSYYQSIFAGDGDDYVVGGDNWYGSYIDLGNGDDTIVVPQEIGEGTDILDDADFDEYLTIYGGEGNDTWIVDSYGDV